jgi:2-isopropylmalate synthase
MEGEGFHFEVADGSFQLLVRRTLGMVKKEKFRVLGYRVIEECRNNRYAYSEATVKLDVQGRVMHMAAEGNGPVDAMARAVRRSLEPAFPQLQNMRLQDYKVRVLEGDSGTASTVRVWIRFQNSKQGKENSWNTIGVSGNIIEASWMALLDGFNYMLLIK